MEAVAYAPVAAYVVPIVISAGAFDVDVDVDVDGSIDIHVDRFGLDLIHSPSSVGVFEAEMAV